jgi:RNA-directed DNA polymerase
LGIPTIKDRVVQMAALVVWEPIFEADLLPEQYAYRQGRSALEAVRHVQRLLLEGHTEVVDADLSGYFDSIPHAELLKAVARRVSDRHLLALIKRWLETPVAETDERGRQKRTTRAKDTGRGTPQGAPLSPLLANLYRRRFLLGWKVFGHERNLDAHLVNYADDFVICCRGTATEAMARMRDLMARLRLTVNDTKTRICQGAEATFDFLGYSIGKLWSPQTGRSYLGVKPSAKKVRALREEIRDRTDRGQEWREPAELVGRLNQQLEGWANYFCLGSVTKAYRTVMGYTCDRLRQWLARKYDVQGTAYARYPNSYLYDTLGLLQLRRRPSRFSWANV